MAASTPTGPNSPVVRTLGILSVLIALAGVIAVFAKGSDNNNSSSGNPGGGTTPIATPTGTGTASPLPSPTVTPSASPHATGSGQPAGSASPAVTPTATHGGGHSTAPTTPASPTTATSPTSNGGHQVTIQAPPLGNYSYATTGGESTSFPGTGRTFPKTTTVSLTKSGCGIEETWKPLATHVESEQLCIINNQVHLISTQTTLSFFGQTITQKLTCAKNAYIYAPTVRPGDTWSFTCTGEGATVTQTLKAVRYQTFNVGGTNVKTVKITVGSAVKGGDSGTSKQTLWIAATNRPQMIRNMSSIEAKQGSFSYKENATLQLKSLTPA